MDSSGIDLLPALRRVYGEVPEFELQPMAGDASSRTYYRLRVSGGTPSSLVVMHLPPDPLVSDEASGDAPETLPFLSVQALLSERGVRVPAILADDVPRRVVLLEDLGDRTFFASQEATDEAGREALYEQAVDLLVELHRRGTPTSSSPVHQRRFDRALLRWELDHFRKWGLEAIHGPLPAAERAALDGHFDRVTDALVAMPTGFVHRDYQSRNLMHLPDESLVVIDFQDALLGPRIYDLVALLCDSYVDLPEALQTRLIARYAAATGIDAAEASAEFWCVSLQRKLKDAGRFVFIDQVRGNAGYLPSFPQSMRYVGRAARHADARFPGLQALLLRLIPGFPDDVVVPEAATGTRSGET